MRKQRRYVLSGKGMWIISVALLVLTVNSLAKEPYPAGVPEECVLSLTAAQTSQMLKGRNSP